MQTAVARRVGLKATHALRLCTSRQPCRQGPHAEPLTSAPSVGRKAEAGGSVRVLQLLRPQQAGAPVPHDQLQQEEGARPCSNRWRQQGAQSCLNHQRQQENSAEGSASAVRALGALTFISGSIHCLCDQGRRRQGRQDSSPEPTAAGWGWVQRIPAQGTETLQAKDSCLSSRSRICREPPLNSPVAAAASGVVWSANEPPFQKRSLQEEMDSTVGRVQIFSMSCLVHAPGQAVVSALTSSSAAGCRLCSCCCCAPPTPCACCPV